MLLSLEMSLHAVACHLGQEPNCSPIERLLLVALVSRYSKVDQIFKFFSVPSSFATLEAHLSLPYSYTLSKSSMLVRQR